MSEFSDLLSKFIDEKNITVYSMVQYCSLDRSTMYKIINGKRKPSSLQLVHKICEYMNLTPKETLQLTDAYQISVIGPDKYYRRKHVKSFIKNFHTLCVPFCKTVQFSPCPEEEYPSGNGFYTLSGRSQINNALFEMLTQNISHIQMVVQPEYSFLMDLLVSISQSGSIREIQHILCLSNVQSITPEHRHYNLMCLEKILPMYYGNCKYTPYYYYDNINSHFHTLTPMPYFILTDTGLLTCSSDIQHGILYRDASAIKLFQEIFREYQQHTSQLIRQVNSFAKQCTALSRIKPGSDVSYTLQAEPCMVPFIPKSWLEKYIYPDYPDRDIVISLLESYIPHTAFRLSDKNVLYFSKKGVLSFMETGKIGEIPDNLCMPFSLPDRIYLLSRLIDSCRETDYYLLKNDLSEIPPKLYIYANARCGYLLFPDTGGCITHLYLEEHSLLETFHDFMESLNDNDFIYSKEETIQFLKSTLEDYKDRTGVCPPPA